jgi:hypothetical protein
MLACRVVFVDVLCLSLQATTPTACPLCGKVVQCRTSDFVGSNDAKKLRCGVGDVLFGRGSLALICLCVVLDAGRNGCDGGITCGKHTI